MKETNWEKTAEKAPETGTPVTDGEGICPHCDARLVVVAEGSVWCWRCGQASCFVQKDAQVWLCRIDGIESEDEDQSFFDDGIDPDGGLHGLCPCCEERLFSWFAGRCRCEACGGLFVIQRLRGSGRYRWFIDEALFNSYQGRVRMAWRDE